MNRTILFSVFLIFMIVISTGNACTRRLGRCSDSTECCSRYCRNGQCIRYGDAADDRQSRNPCKPSPCERGQTCYLQQVTCVRFPCPPIANCQ